MGYYCRLCHYPGDRSWFGAHIVGLRWLSLAYVAAAAAVAVTGARAAGAAVLVPGTLRYGYGRIEPAVVSLCWLTLAVVGLRWPSGCGLVVVGLVGLVDL